MESADCSWLLFNCLKKFRGQNERNFDLANTTNKNQIKGEQQLKCLTESVEFFSAGFDEYEADCKKKDKIINSLDEKVLGQSFRIDWKS